MERRRRATFDGFLQCVDNPNPVAGIRRGVATALSSDCESESSQAIAHAFFGAGMLAAPGVKGRRAQVIPLQEARILAIDPGAVFTLRLVP